MAKEISVHGLIRKVGDELADRGWRDDEDLALAIAQAMAERGSLDVGAAMKVDSSDFRARNEAKLAELREAVEAAFDGLELAADKQEATGDTTYNIGHIGGDANLADMRNSTGVKVRQGGTDIDYNGADPETLLQAVRELALAGFHGHWDDDQAERLGQALEGRDDLNRDQFRDAVTEAGRESGASREKIEQFGRQVAAGGLGGFLSWALQSGAAEAIGGLG